MAWHNSGFALLVKVSQEDAPSLGQGFLRCGPWIARLFSQHTETLPALCALMFSQPRVEFSRGCVFYAITRDENLATVFQPDIRDL